MRIVVDNNNADITKIKEQRIASEKQRCANLKLAMKKYWKNNEDVVSRH